MKTVVLITSGQPSSNPRIVKEATALAEKGYHVTVLYCFWVKWARKYDEEIIKRFSNIQWIETGGNPETAVNAYLFSRFCHKVYRFFYQLFPGNLYFSARAEIRCYQALLSSAKKKKADMYVAHNLGALSIAAKVALKYSAPYAFDAEDFHRGEVAEKSKSFQRTRKLEDSFLPRASYISAASPLIAQNYESLYNKKVTVLYNVFPKTYQPFFKELPFDKLKMVWFSQTIGLNRGIQDVLKVMNEIHEKKITITLVGLCTKEIEQALRELLTNNLHTLVFLQPLRETDLLELCSRHHIGLALERRVPINRNICLTNKIFTYLLAGNAIIASDTDAQKQFFEQHSDIGSIYQIDRSETLKQVLLSFIDDQALLAQTRKHAYQLAMQKFNWENEKAKLHAAIDEVLNKCL